MNKIPPRPPLSEDDAFTELTSIQPTADRVRFAALEQTLQFSAAKTRSLRRQEKDAVERYGANAPETVVLRQRLVSEERFTAAAEAEGERAQTDRVQRDPKAFTLLGRVVNLRRLGLAKLTVSAIDRRGKAAASTVSSATGHFQLQVPVASADEPMVVTLLVSDASKRVLYRGCECFQVVGGKVVTRELVLGSAEPVPQPTPPPDIDPQKVAVPDVRGLPQRDAKRQLKALCLETAITPQEASPEQVGRVLAQDPDPGTTVPLASQVKLTVGIASETVAVPDLVGLPRDEASAKLDEAGLALGSIGFETAPRNQVGRVLRQQPKAGTRVPAGTAVDVVIGREQELIAVPELREQSLEAARKLLKKAKLTTGTIEPPDSPESSLVIEQDPAPGAQVPAETAVHLKVRVPDQPTTEVTVPNLIEQPLEVAAQILKRARLARGTIQPPNAPAESRVIGQKPAAGKVVSTGTPVDLEVKFEEGDRPRPRPRPAETRAVSAKKTPRKKAAPTKKAARKPSPDTEPP